MTTTTDERAHRNLLELIQDEGEHAYDDVRNWYPTADPTKVAQLVEEVGVIIVDAKQIEADFPADRFMTSLELAREHLWLADDLIAAFLREVA